MTPLFYLTLWLFIGIATFVYLLIINEVMLSYFHLFTITLSGPITPFLLLWMRLIEYLEEIFKPTDIRDTIKAQEEQSVQPVNQFKVKQRSNIIGLILSTIVCISGLLYTIFGNAYGVIPFILGLVCIIYFWLIRKVELE